MAEQSRDFLKLAGKVVVVTGASAGLGEGIALEFARQGCLLMLCGRNKERLDDVAARCGQLSSQKVATTIGDIVDEKVQQEVISNTLKSFGGLDVLVNNVGTNSLGSCLEASRSDYSTIMKTNVESVFFLTQLAVPHLIKTKGCVVNISSVASERQMHKSAVYSMSKAAMDSFTKCLAMELADSGVRVNSVNPGTVVTMLYRRGENAFSDEKLAQFERSQSSPTIHPLGRVGVASEVADAVMYLASPRASFITGQMVFVDGGRHIATAQPKFAADNQ